MTRKKWALRPGEQKLEETYKKEYNNNLDKLYSDLVSNYLENVDNRPIILNDSKEIVYFIEHSKTGLIEKSSVAIYDGFQYSFVPQALAVNICKSYIQYIDTVALAYEYLYE
jgi:hypothetical protein